MFFDRMRANNRQLKCEQFNEYNQKIDEVFLKNKLKLLLICQITAKKPQ